MEVPQFIENEGTRIYKGAKVTYKNTRGIKKGAKVVDFQKAVNWVAFLSDGEFVSPENLKVIGREKKWKPTK